VLPGSAVIGSSSSVAHPPLEEAGHPAVAKGERVNDLLPSVGEREAPRSNIAGAVNNQ
jgi:hypothetical protein